MQIHAGLYALVRVYLLMLADVRLLWCEAIDDRWWSRRKHWSLKRGARYISSRAVIWGRDRRVPTETLVHVGMICMGMGHTLGVGGNLNK